MFRALGSSRLPAIDPGSRTPYVATCPKQSSGTVAGDADRKESVAPAGGKLLGADRRQGSGAGSPVSGGDGAGRLLGTLRLVPQPLGFGLVAAGPG